jgi:hypothetical protein
MEGKYSIELFRDGGEGAGIEKILVRHDSLTAARVLYKAVVLNYAERLIMLCDRARVLARSDRPETMPENKRAAPSPGPLRHNISASLTRVLCIKPILIIEANKSHDITESLRFSLRHMRALPPSGGDMSGNTIDVGSQVSPHMNHR